MPAENTIMLSERTDELLNRGRSQGFISTEDVADLLQEGELSATEVEEFYATLEEEAISIIEGEGTSLPEAASGVQPSGAVPATPEPPAMQIAHAVAPHAGYSYEGEAGLDKTRVVGHAADAVHPRRYLRFQYLG